MTTDTLLVLFDLSPGHLPSLAQTLSDMATLLPRPETVRTVNSVEVQGIVSVHVTLPRLVATSRDHYFTFGIADRKSVV